MYRHLPTLGRRWVVRTIAPSYTVGAMGIIERADGALLLVRHVYRRHWGVPGGLLQRGEAPEEAVRREVLEEVGLRVTLVGEPTVVVDPEPQRVDIVFRANPATDTDASRVEPSSEEIIETRWFLPGELPELQHETAGALIALARASRTPPGHRLAGAWLEPEHHERRVDSA